MWVNAEDAGLNEGPTEIKWPDGWVSVERIQKVDNVLSVMTSHRGVEFSAPLAGRGFLVDDGKKESDMEKHDVGLTPHSDEPAPAAPVSEPQPPAEPPPKPDATPQRVDLLK